MKFKIYINLVIVIALFSCTNPFQLRDSEDPTGGNVDNSRFLYQLHPDSLIVKMKLAFRQKDNQLYEDLFPTGGRDSVVFKFDPVPFYLDRLDNWSVLDELGYFQNLVKSTNIGSLSLNMTKTQAWVSVAESLDTLQAQYEYDIKLVTLPNKENHYKGSAIFKIYKGSDSYYRIFYWQDLPLREGDSDSTWSALKAEFQINE